MKTPKPTHNQSARTLPNDSALSLPKDWREVKLGDVAEIIMGQSPKSETYNENSEGLPFYQGIVDFGDRFTAPRVYCSDPKKVIEAGDILLSVRAPVGEVNFTKEKCSIGRGNAGLRMKSGIQDFLFYLLKFSENKFHSNSSGSVFSSINKSNIENLEISLPPLPEQKAIAEILSSLDEKIDLLHRQNKTLEDIAQTLFRQWFIEQAQDDWEVGILDDILTVKGGTTPSTKNPEYWDGNIHWTTPKDLSSDCPMFLMNTLRKITKKGLDKIGSGLLPKGTLLLSSRAPVGYMAFSAVPIAINQGYIAIIEDKGYSKLFIYSWLKLNMNYVKSFANGSTFQEISKTAFKSLEIVMPSKDKREKFDEIIKPLFEKILSNQTQIMTLENLCDTLLPKLMSGKIRVKIK